MLSVLVAPQVVVQGLPWAYTQEQLTPMFQQFGKIVSAEVVYGRDGRSRVRFKLLSEGDTAVKSAGMRMQGAC